MSWKNERQKMSGQKRPELNMQVSTDNEAGVAAANAQIALENAQALALQRLARESTDPATDRAEIDKAVAKDKAVVAAKKALTAAQARYQMSLVDFTFRGLPSHEYEELKAQHPDPEGQRDFHAETFAPALVAACHVYYEKDETTGEHLRDKDGNLIEGPGMEDAAEAAALMADMTVADKTSLWEAALAVNVTPQVDLVALGKD